MKLKKSILAEILTGDWSSLSDEEITKIAKAVDAIADVDDVDGLSDALPLTLRAWDDGSSDQRAVTRDDDFEAEARDLWEGAEYGDGDWRVTVRWEVKDSLGREVESGEFDLEHETEEPECPESEDGHDWTSEHEGGLDENPGVWSTGGTSMAFYAHCRRCGMSRVERTTGAQCNPGECDTTEYGDPDPEWVAQYYPTN